MTVMKWPFFGAGKHARAVRKRQVPVRREIRKTMQPWRRFTVLAVFLVLTGVLLGKALDMQVLRSDFYQEQGAARQIRTVAIPAHRGDIVDRSGLPLAISAPVKSIWINPGALMDYVAEQSVKNAAGESEGGIEHLLRQQLSKLASLLDLNVVALADRVSRNGTKEFLYVKRQIAPALAERVMALAVPGVATQSEYRRYYTSGEVTAHVLGFADIDDNGQEGLERAYDAVLKGVPGKKKVLRNRLGGVIDDLARIKPVQQGEDLQLSIDKGLQYLAYRALKAAVIRHNAVSGSAVVLDANSGEVLAMVNQPSFNVNDRKQLTPQATRNRAVIDVFEPGSTMKPISMAAALESGKWTPFDTVSTAPGILKIGANVIRDAHNYGDLDVGGVIEKSSNVGISKIVLSIDEEQQWDMYKKAGFGMNTGSGFPGEANGRLSVESMRSDFARASMAYGYGISVTPLQLARAYAAIANDGVLKPISFLHDDSAGSMPGERIMSVATARAIRKMMQRVVSDSGTGRRARVANYSVAGKTGTVHKYIAGGYAEDRYLSIFAGMVPADKPALVMVVVIDEPKNGEHFGGQVAAPVFSQVMSEAVRLLNIAPDRISDRQFVSSRFLRDESGQVAGEKG